ncbi:hypothetical protein [Rudanella lutea]|uniref:hypothetical protein n=1 Tax=Rudanella lutea TaxID=451374 RepID=UPI000361AC8B|nr:hypothetical protein [Rudanella lutea]
MEAIFTIVAKNYIPLAKVLGDSICKHHPDTPFYIVVADTADGLIDFSNQAYPIIPSEDLSIPSMKELAFKYNVTEFCTALKPFAYKYFFQKGYNKVLYFDPDIYVFSPLNKIYGELDSASMVITPHYQTPEPIYSGIFREGNILFAGIFNLGFCGISNTIEGNRIIEWWCQRLQSHCYADRTDGLHVDQKWVDFIPVLFSHVHVERGLGYNIAIWNWHEREISYHDDKYWVKNRITGGAEEPVIFYHYSNYKFKLANSFENFIPVNSNRFPDIKTISEFYANLLVQENISSKLSILKYSFSTFDNNMPVTQFHRRFLRQLLDMNVSFEDPFLTEPQDSFFNILQKSGLIVYNDSSDKLNEINFKGFDRKIAYINTMAKITKKILGFERYALLCKFMFRYVRPENQLFLLKQDKIKPSFVNENRYINV